MHLILASFETALDPLASPAMADTNPKLAVLCDLIDVSSVLRLAILRVKSDRRAKVWELADLERGLAAADRAKQHIYDELHKPNTKELPNDGPVA